MCFTYIEKAFFLNEFSTELLRGTFLHYYCSNIHVARIRQSFHNVKKKMAQVARFSSRLIDNCHLYYYIYA